MHKINKLFPIQKYCCLPYLRGSSLARDCVQGCYPTQ